MMAEIEIKPSTIHPGARKTWRLRVHEFLAAPAHGWIWLCSKLLGLRFYVLVGGCLNDAGEIDTTSVYVDDRLAD